MNIEAQINNQSAVISREAILAAQQAIAQQNRDIEARMAVQLIGRLDGAINDSVQLVRDARKIEKAGLAKLEKLNKIKEDFLADGDVANLNKGLDTLLK